MGIKGLWTVFTPFSEKKSLHEISGETVAVDLSGWVCDSQNITDYHVQPKLYLRNLFFRTVYLLLADITPIFVLEGDAPELKRDVMAARNAIQFRGAAPRSENAVAKKRPDVGRKRFRNVLKECESLLKCMGVSCIKGAGEAEATCAALNAQGLVDAVVSQDSDCFAYGARRVYRNFSVSSAAGGGAMQGSVDCYDAGTMLRANGFGRNKMVALALLCGCDYGVGACGTSINTALAFLHSVSDSDIIPRLLSWVSDPQHYEEQTRWSSAPGRCDRCGHVGRAHVKSGCPVCATHRGCDDLGHKAKVAEVKRELSLRNRAINCGMPFPEPKVMKEFLKIAPEKVDVNSLKKPAPSMIQFIRIMTSKLDWSEKYCVVKFLPVLTKWHLQDDVPCRTIEPLTIKKKRNPRGVPSYEVVWGDIDGQYEALIPDDQFEDDEDPLSPWTTTEKQELMRKYYPSLVLTYEESIKKPPKEKKTRAKKKQDGEVEKPKRKYTKRTKKIVDDINKSSNNKTDGVSNSNSSKLNVSVSITKLKRKLKYKGNQKTIDSFIANKRPKTKKAMESLRSSFKRMSIVNVSDKYEIVDDKKGNELENKHYLSMFDDTNGCDDIDLSDIVDRIVSRAPITKTTKLESNMVKLVFDNKTYSTPRKSHRKSILRNVLNNCSTPNESPIRRSSINLGNITNGSMNLIVNTSYFFDKLTEDRDAFEISVDYKHKSAILAVDCDTTIDYSLPDVRL